MTLFDNPAHPLRHESLCSWLSESCKCERKYAQKSLAFVREALACLIQKARAAGIENCPCFLREKARFEQIIRDFSQIHGENNDRGAFCDTHRILCNQIGPQNQNDPQKCEELKARIKVLVEQKLAENARIRGSQLLQHFDDLKSEFPDKIKEIRGKGLLTAFEMHNEKKLDGHIVSMELMNKGVYAKETHHSTVRIAPALTIESWQIDDLAEAIRDVVKNL